MSDLQNFEGLFERQLRSYAAAGAPIIHRQAVSRAVAAGVDSRRANRWGLLWPTPNRTMFTQLATVGMLIVGVAIGFAIWSGLNNQVLLPGATPTPSPLPSPTRTVTPPASPKPTQPGSPSPSSGGPTNAPATDEVVRPWPGNRGGTPRGLYSWDVSRGCGTADCVFGRIHNHRNAAENRNADVEIGISMPGSAAPDEGGTAVTVAGHPGTYYRIDGQHETWRVDIQGTTIEIDLEAQRGASQGDLDEAHAIIDSMRTEPWDNILGFRIVFRLETTYWDSPF